MNRLQDKIAVVTGGMSGIGKAIVSLFYAEGAKLVIGDLNAADHEEEGKLYVKTDITDRGQVDALIQTAIDHFGRIDVMVCDAGVLDAGLKPINAFLDEDMDRDYEVNMKGTAMCMRAASNQMIEQGSGSIVNIASIAGVIGNGSTPYVATKAAIIGMTRHAAYALASKGIRINAICPGTVATPMGNIDPKALNQDMLSSVYKHSDLSLGICQPEDIANVALFLASDESKALNGQILQADKGVNL